MFCSALEVVVLIFHWSVEFCWPRGASSIILIQAKLPFGRVYLSGFWLNLYCTCLNLWFHMPSGSPSTCTFTLSVFLLLSLFILLSLLWKDVSCSVTKAASEADNTLGGCWRHDSLEVTLLCRERALLHHLPSWAKPPTVLSSLPVSLPALLPLLLLAILILRWVSEAKGIFQTKIKVGLSYMHCCSAGWPHSTCYTEAWCFCPSTF